MTAVYLDERIEEQRGYIAQLEADYADLRDGTKSWREVYPELTCADRQQAAAEECWEAIRAAQNELEALTKGNAATGRQGVGEQ